MHSFISNLLTEIRALPRPVYLLIFGQFLNRFGTFVYPFLTLYLQERNFGMIYISGVLAAISLGNLVGPIAGGYLADAIGRRNTIVVSLVSSATSLLALYHSEHYIILLFVSAAYGFSNFLFGPPSNALIVDLVPASRRVTAFAMLRLAINAGFAAGPMIAGLLFVYSPALIFYGDAATTLGFAILAWRYLPHGLRTIRGQITSPKVVLKSWKSTIADVLENRSYLQFLIGGCVLMGFAFSQVFSVLAISTTNSGISPSIYGVIMGFNGILIILIEIPLTHWLKRFPSRIVLTIGYAVIATGVVAFGLATTASDHFLAMGIFTLGEIIALPIGMAYSSNLAPEKHRGRYFGLRGMSWALSGLLASVGVWFYSIMGPAWWHVAATVGFAGAVFIALPNKQRSKKPTAPLLPAKKFVSHF